MTTSTGSSHDLDQHLEQTRRLQLKVASLIRERHALLGRLRSEFVVSQVRDRSAVFDILDRIEREMEEECRL